MKRILQEKWNSFGTRWLMYLLMYPEKTTNGLFLKAQTSEEGSKPEKGSSQE